MQRSNTPNIDAARQALDADGYKLSRQEHSENPSMLVTHYISPLGDHTILITNHAHDEITWLEQFPFAQRSRRTKAEKPA